MILLPGSTITGSSGPNTLRLDELLGNGAFGFVYAAIDITTDERIAVKFPYAGAFRDNSELMAFANEVRAAREIQHPNVVRVRFTHSDSTGSTAPYLVMEYIEGGTLEDRLDALQNQGSLPSLGQLHVWMNQLIDGIEAINKRMLHRDIKPDNILIDGETLKIADFGLSKLVGAATRTRTFKGMGALYYMAPEGWKLETNAIQLDMYSMGIVFFQMMTLGYPYETPALPHSPDSAFRDMHLYQTPKRIRDFRDDIPVGVTQIVERMLEKRAADRFSTWDDIRQRLAVAWDRSTQSQNPAMQTLSDQIMDEIGQSHKKRLAEQYEQEQLRHLQEEELRTISWRRDRLIELVRNWVDEFNAQSVHGSIEMWEAATNTASWQHAFRIPDTGRILLTFRRLVPPLELRRGSVPIFACLADEDGAGFNYILVRQNAEDIYGEWQICKFRTSGFANPRKYPRRPEPFGFESEKEFQKHVSLAEKSMHVYTCEFEEATIDQFATVVREFIRRRRENPEG